MHALAYKPVLTPAPALALAPAAASPLSLSTQAVMLAVAPGVATAHAAAEWALQNPHPDLRPVDAAQLGVALRQELAQMVQHAGVRGPWGQHLV